MALILKAISYKGLPLAQEISVQFDEQGGTIGRAPDNHLVLPDPEKSISRHHAHINFQGGQYFIRDSSAGGTYLGLKDTLLKQNQAPLENGERLQIGEYELLVSLTTNVQAVFSPIVEPVRQLELAESNILEDPFAAPQKPAVAPGFDSSFINQPESSVFRQSFTPPQVVSKPPTDNDSDLNPDDLLSSLDTLFGARGFQKPELPPLPDDFFAEEFKNTDSPEPPETLPDFSALFNESDSDVPADAIATPLVAASPSAGSASIEFNPKDQAIFSLTSSTSNLSHASVNQLGSPEVADTLTANGAPVQPESDKSTANNDKSQPGQHAAVADSELLRQFLTGLGIADTHFLPAEQWPQLMRTSGELLRSMVAGLMLVLRARAELKSQFRVSVTTMRSIDNNPLKFTPNAEDAIKLMLAPTNPGFLPPKEAVHEGFSDIMNHQMAMTAGIQAALAEILGSFDPSLIEKNQGEGLLFQKKAKYWEYYTQKYPELKAVAQEQFFGDTFAEAYEKQMRLLSRSTKTQ